MKKLTILTIFTCIVFLATAQDATHFYGKGIEATKAGNYLQAIDYFSKAIKEDNSLKEAWFNCGLARSRMGNFEGAIADYSIAIELDPAFAMAWLNRGADKKELTDMEGALADYSKAISIDPHYALAYYNRGIIYYEQARYEQALMDFSKAVTEDPKMKDAWLNKAITETRLDQNDNALAAFTKVIQLEPKHAIAHRYRGIILANAGAYEKAADDLQQAVLGMPSDCEALCWLGFAKQQLGRNAESEICLTKAKTLGCPAQKKMELAIFQKRK